MYVYKSVAKSRVTNAHYIIHSVLTGSRSPAGPRRRRKRTHAIGVHPLPPAVLSVVISLAAQDRAVAEGGKARVSPCEPLCAILLRKPSVYPLSRMKANVGRSCQRRRSPCDQRVRDVGMTAFPALFTAFSRTKKKAGERHWRFSRQCLFTAARSASCRKGLRVLEIDAFFEVPRTV